MISCNVQDSLLNLPLYIHIAFKHIGILYTDKCSKMQKKDAKNVHE
jgi:hypothetical protein